MESPLQKSFESTQCLLSIKLIMMAFSFMYSTGTKGMFLPLGTVVGQLCGPHTPTLIVTVGFLYKSLSIIS